MNKICNGRTSDDRRISAKLIAIDGDVLIFQNSRGAIFRHAIRDLIYLEPRAETTGDGGRS
ncbi:hypothetical protein [Candidatus Methanocrinis natronophilus]|uniref:DUF91 domain-containing protein n=1 Tax=Candidatus Methanocrinis natronophilus TaxID=3033396 RepID=A0ABT5XAL3_9EURY|nr:hypothetical protein [Candidatus Methanocrinis natronophilus]MDF0591728.1 hypothetical protein [Candidatus Methanocrinis natronophilus]